MPPTTHFSFLFIILNEIGIKCEHEQKELRFRFPLHLVQWSMTSIPVSDYLSSIPITSPLSFQYHSSHYAYPLLLLYHCDCCLSTPMRVPIAHHPHSCALPRHPRYPERPVGAFRCLSLSVMSLWRKRLLLEKMKEFK